MPTMEPPAKPETLADKLSAVVEKRSREQQANQPPQEAPAANPDPTPAPAAEKAQSAQNAPDKPAKVVQRRKSAQAPAEAVLPPDEVDPLPSPDPSIDVSAIAIEEQLQKHDKTDGIKALRDAYAAEKQKRLDLENQLKQAATATPKVPDDYEAIKKQASEYSTELEKLALERHPEFRKRFGAAQDGLDSAAKKLAASLPTAANPDSLVAILSEPASDSKTERVNALLEGASPLVASKVANLVSNYEQLHEQRTSMLSKHAESLRNLDMQQRAETQQRIEREQLGFEQVVGDLSGQLEYLTPVEGNAEWNSLVNNLKAKAKNLYFSEKDPAALMKATVLASVAEPYRNAYLLMKAQNQKLQDRLSAIEKAAPGFDGSGSRAGSRDEGWDEKKSFADNLANAVANKSGMGGRAG